MYYQLLRGLYDEKAHNSEGKRSGGWRAMTADSTPAASASSSAPDRNAAFAALRHPEFRALAVGTFVLTAAILIQEVALGYELYRLTGDPLVLGFIGLAEAIPFMSLALFGGHLADRREKRRLMQLALGVMLLGSLALWFITLPASREQLGQSRMLLAVYGVIVIIGFARGIYSPTASALKAFLVPRALYGNAATWGSSAWQAGAIVGPALSGLFLLWFGFSGTLLAVAVLVAAVIGITQLIRPRPVLAPVEPHESVWASLREGLAYVRRTRVILYAISLDMFSVLFGGVVAILPVFARDVLHAGPEGLGILRAAPAVGALATMLLLAWYPPMQHAWRNMLLAVLGFGIATLVFALSGWFWLSAFALLLTGAFDSVSVIIRGTLLQLLTPDHLRGRVQSVNSIFLSASNELGAFESGVAARLMGAVPSVVFGGAVTVATVGWIWRRSRDLLGLRFN
jgi:MFS family permease